MSCGNQQEPAEPQSPAAGNERPPGGEEEGEASPEVREIGGPKGPEPTRYGDWERAGRCVDF